MKKIIPYSTQSISDHDIAEVVKALRSGWLTQGPKIEEFEHKLARYTGARYAVVVANGTAALHLACLALGVQAGDEVITSPITFLASANCVLYAGGKPVFADIEPERLTLDPQKAIKLVNRKTRGLIPIDFAGQPADLPNLYRLARQKGLFVLEDGCHAIGGTYSVRGKQYKIGGCHHADACVFSFHPVKGLTTGEGGAVTTNRRDIYEKLIQLRTHGVTKEPSVLKNKKMAFDQGRSKKPGGWYYEMQMLGFNYRLTDFQCALGISQLARLDTFVEKRRAIAAFYDDAFKGFPLLETPHRIAGSQSAYHLYPIQLCLDQLKVSRHTVFEELRKQGLGVQVHYIPVHLQPFYQKRGWRAGQFPMAEAYYERTLSIPVYPGLTKIQARRVVQTVKRVLTQYQR